MTCGRERGEDGTEVRCRVHAKLHSKGQSKTRAKNKVLWLKQHRCIECGVQLKAKKDQLCQFHKMKSQHRQRRHRLQQSPY